MYTEIVKCPYCQRETEITYEPGDLFLDHESIVRVTRECGMCEAEFDIEVEAVTSFEVRVVKPEYEPDGERHTGYTH